MKKKKREKKKKEERIEKKDMLSKDQDLDLSDFLLNSSKLVFL